jgi:hypothetical protein
MRNQQQNFLGLAALGNADDHILLENSSRIAVQPLGRMEEDCGRPRAGQHGSNLVCDDSGLPHAGDNDAALAGQQQIDGFLKTGVDPFFERAYGLCLDPDDFPSLGDARIQQPASFLSGLTIYFF